jgi:hypothetical protein
MDELLTRGDRVIFRQPVDMSNKKMLCNDNVYIVSKVGALNGCSNKNIFLRCKTCAAYCVCVTDSYNQISSVLYSACRFVKLGEGN